MPDSTGPGWPLGAGRPPAGRMTRAGRGPARNGRAGAARRDAGGGAARGGPTPRGFEADAGGARADAGTGGRRQANGPAATPRTPPGTGGAGGGLRNETRGPRSGDHRSGRGRRTPPTCPWGVRRPRGGHDARLIRARMALGRRQAPRRPHDAGRPPRALAGARNFRRPDRGGRPMLGDGGPPPGGGGDLRRRGTTG